MIQAKFSLDEKQLQFLNACKSFGFKDKSEMLRVALSRFQAELDSQALEQSAALNARVPVIQVIPVTEWSEKKPYPHKLCFRALT